jgi:transcriptional regulator with XRE-family HTH domain
MTRNTTNFLNRGNPLGGDDRPVGDRRLTESEPRREPGDESPIFADEIHAVHETDISPSQDQDQAGNIENNNAGQSYDSAMQSPSVSARLGPILREARKRLGWRQIDVARRLRVPQSSISQWEKGDYIPSLENRFALAAVLHISLRDLMPEAEDLPPDAFKDPQTRRIIELLWKLDSPLRSMIEMLLVRLVEKSEPDPPSSPPETPPPRTPRRRRR